MESDAADKYQAGSSSKGVSSGSSSYGDLDVVEVSSPASASASWACNQQKRKRSQVAAHDVIEIDDDDPAAVIPGNASGNKLKQAVEVEHWQKHTEDAFADDLVGSSTYYASEADKSWEGLESMEAEDDNDDADADEDYGFEYEEEDDYNEYVFEEDVIENDSDYNLAAKFDNLDLPPGVEANVSWWETLSSDKTTKSKKAVNVDEIDDKFENFRQFDVVQDYSDHHFSKPENTKGISLAKKPPKDWTKRIHHEWKILEKDLPETIFVRAYEERMDLLRAVIIGPAGTPYHDGLFFFDCFFPSTYPDTPPLVHHLSRGLRLNPNLYGCGKVCLSLLGTWTGNGCEKWRPGKSTMLQVLVSIQALVLNAKPYFNEPGYELTAKTATGEQKSLAYNEETFLLSCKMMMHSLQKPPKNFEDFTTGHFRKYGRAILLACRAYINGTQVGCVVGDGVQDADEGDKSSSSSFQMRLKKLFEELLMEFTVKGADCDVFLSQKVKAGLAKAKAVCAADTTLRL